MTREDETVKLTFRPSEKLVIYPLIIRTRSHLRVGGGTLAAHVKFADLPVAKMHVVEGGRWYAVPYVPGSSVHGLMRSFYESLVRRKAKVLTEHETERLSDKLNEAVRDQPDDNRRRDAARAIVRSMLDDLEYLLGVGLLSDEVQKFLLEKRSEDSRAKLVESAISEEGSPDREPFEKLVRYWANAMQISPDVCHIYSDLDKCENLGSRSPDDPLRRVKETYFLSINRGASGCKVCRYFGRLGERGRVRTTHVVPVERAIPLDTVTHVTINRLTGASATRLLFDEEVIPPGVLLLGFVALEVDTAGEGVGFQNSFEEDVLGRFIESLNRGEITMGARGTTGHGIVKVEYPSPGAVGSSKLELAVGAEPPRDATANLPEDLREEMKCEEGWIKRFFPKAWVDWLLGEKLHGETGGGT